MASNDILSICEDNNGSIWFGTSGSGPCRYDGKAFTTYSSDQGLAANSVIGIVEDKGGDLWFATDGTGVSRYEAFPADGGPARFTTYTTAQGLGKNVINGILADRTGDIWFATGGVGVSHYSEQTGKNGACITTYTKAHGLPASSFSSIAEDIEGKLWFGTYGAGVTCFDGKSFTNYSSPQGLTNGHVNTLLADKSGNVWMGTSGGGVFCYDAAASRAKGKVIFRNYTKANGLGSDFVWSLWQDKSGNIWIGTDGGGASWFDGKKFATFNSANGLGSNGVYNIKEDRNKNIWFGTNDGFTVFTGNKKVTGDGLAAEAKLFPADNIHRNNDLTENYEPVFERYHFKNGYPVKDVNSNAMYIDSKGIVWAGSGDKLVRFDYSGIRKNNGTPHIFLDAVKIDGEPVCWSDLKGKAARKDSLTLVNEEVRTFGNVLSPERRDSMVRKFARVRFDSVTRFYSIPLHLVLPYKHNKISFEFGANELARPYMVRYQYILEGYDKDWETVTDKTSAAFGNIREGTYTFKLKAQSPDGVWSEPIPYTFTVSPPTYRTWWAYCLYLLALVYAAIAIFRWRTASLRREKETLEKVVIERTAQVVEEKAKVVKLVEEQEQTIAERTAELANANKKLVELIQYNAHYMREPLARIMGAINISEFLDHEEFTNDIIPQMTRAVNDLDNAIKEVIKVADETVELKK